MHLWLTLNIVTTKLALSAGQDCLQIHVLGLLIVYEFRAPSLSSETKQKNTTQSTPSLMKLASKYFKCLIYDPEQSHIIPC